MRKKEKESQEEYKQKERDSDRERSKGEKNVVDNIETLKTKEREKEEIETDQCSVDVIKCQVFMQTEKM